FLATVCRPSADGPARLTLRRSLLAEREQQILVELHPHRVVRVDAGRREPLVVAVFDALARGAQPASVAAESIEVARDARDERAHAVVDRREAVEDRPVVLGILVIVGRAARPHLPIAAEPEQLRVEDQESLVRTLDRRLELAAGFDARPCGMGL